MLAFTPSGIEVYFDVLDYDLRTVEARIGLDDYLGLSRANNNLEELRIAVLVWKHLQEKQAAA